MTATEAQIAALIKDNWEDILSIRRHLHQYPELSFQETETSAYIASVLDRLGIPYIPVADTGILATIKGKNPSSKLIVLRGDIDALPIRENTGLPFSSRIET